MMNVDRRQLAVLAMAAVSFLSLGASAQGAYPNQAIKIVVPFTPVSYTHLRAHETG
jgi:tripartite-type tricarboxylate transporter receptor subunit TctC